MPGEGKPSSNTNLKLDMDESGPTIDITKYRGVIGYLLYLTGSRPDIMFVVCVFKVSSRSQRITMHISLKNIIVS